jgi:hypothetical protein
MKNWYRRWMLRRIILALQEAVETHGLKKENVDFCRAMEATYDMAAGMKQDTKLGLSVTKEELGVFLSYMIALHNSKLSLLTRARIGLVTLMISAKKLMPQGQEPMEFAEEQFATSKSGKDDRRIQLVNEFTRTAKKQR